jgi:hypothetical protein
VFDIRLAAITDQDQCRDAVCVKCFCRESSARRRNHAAQSQSTPTKSTQSAPKQTSSGPQRCLPGAARRILSLRRASSHARKTVFTKQLTKVTCEPSSAAAELILPSDLRERVERLPAIQSKTAGLAVRPCDCSIKDMAQHLSFQRGPGQTDVVRLNAPQVSSTATKGKSESASLSKSAWRPL